MIGNVKVEFSLFILSIFEPKCSYLFHILSTDSE